MSVDCSRCGAPIDVSKDSETVQCPYCGNTRVTGARALEPREIARPVHVVRPPRPLILRLPLAFLFLIVSFAVIGLNSRGSAVTDALSPLRSLAAQAGLTQLAWDGSAPFRCSGNEVVTITNVVARLPDRTAMTVGGTAP